MHPPVAGLLASTQQLYWFAMKIYGIAEFIEGFWQKRSRVFIYMRRGADDSAFSGLSIISICQKLINYPERRIFASKQELIIVDIRSLKFHDFENKK